MEHRGDQVAEHAAGGPVAMQPERRLVTALFADISNFTPLAAQLDPEDLVDVIDPTISALSDVVHRFGGYVDKYAGDAVLAFFGAPVGRERDAVRALHAALAMRRALTSRSIGIGGAALSLHIGVHTGHGVGRVLAREARADYSVLGEAIIIAQRLQSAAPTGEIYVSDSTYRLTQRGFLFEPVGDLLLKGKEEPVRAWRLIAARSEPLSSGPLVGRRDQLNDLSAVIERVIAGRGATVAVVGEPGVGKSRLTAAARERAETSGMRWLQASCQSYTTDVAYGPYAELVRQLAGIDIDDDPDDAAQRLASAVGEAAEDPVPVLAPMLGLSADGQPAAGTEPLAAQRRLHRVLVRWVRSEAERHPVALVVEDLHWADAATLELTAELARTCRDEGVLVYVTGRDEGVTAIDSVLAEAEPGRAHHLELRPLARGEIAELARRVSGRQVPDGLMGRLIDAAAGNPFLAEELARSWGRHSEPDLVPMTIEEALSARMDRLPAVAITVLQTAAVIGRRIHLPLLRAVLAGVDGLDDAIEELVRAAFLDPGDSGDVVLHHALVQDVAYTRLLRRHRVRLHREVAMAAMRLFGERDDAVDFLARHCYLGETGAEAVEVLIKAGERAQRLFANDQAILNFERALERLAQVSDAERDEHWRRSMAGRIGRQLGTVLHHVGRFDAARDAYRRGLEATASDAGLDRARFERQMAKTVAAEHRWREAMSGYERAEAELARVPESARSTEWWQQSIQLGLDRWTVYYWTDRLAEMEPLAAGLRGLVERHGARGHRSAYFSSLLTMRMRQHRYGWWDEQPTDVAHLLSASRDTGDPAQIAAATFTAGLLDLCGRRLDDADQRLGDALRLAEETGSSDLRNKCLTYRVVLVRMRGDTSATERAAHHALAALMSSGPQTYVGTAKGNLAWVAWRRGRYGEAKREGHGAMELWAREPAYPFTWAALLALFAVAVSEQDGATAAALGRDVLRSDQQVLPAELETALRAGIDAHETERSCALPAFERAQGIAEALGYL